MTQTPIRPNNPQSNGINSTSMNAKERQIEETLTLVPVTSHSNESNRSALTAKAGALVGELGSLRSNIDMMADELQALLATERAAVERAELLNAMTSHIRESLNFDYILNATVADSRNALDVDRVAVYVFDDNYLAKATHESVERRWSSTLGSLYMDAPLPDQVIKLYEQGRVEAIDDVSTAQISPVLQNQLQKFEAQSSLTTPLLLEGKLYGLLVAHQCSNARQWSESEVEFFRQLAIQVGYALDQAELLEKQQEATEQAQWLNQISVRIRESLTTEDIFNAAVQEVQNALKGDRVTICRLNEDGENQVVAEAVGRQFPSVMAMKLPSPWLDVSHHESYLRGQIHAVADVYDANLEEDDVDQLKARGIRASLVAPVIAKQELIGFLVVHQCSMARQWSDNETEILKKAAIQIGTALDQALALQQQEDAAAQAQILNDISARLGGYTDVEEIVDSVVDDAREALKADRVLIFRVDSQLKGMAIAESAEPRWKSLLGKSLSDCGLDERYVKQSQRGKITTLNQISGAGLSEFQMEHLELSQVRSLILAPITIEKKTLWSNGRAQLPRHSPVERVRK